MTNHNSRARRAAAALAVLSLGAADGTLDHSSGQTAQPATAAPQTTTTKPAAPQTTATKPAPGANPPLAPVPAATPAPIVDGGWPRAYTLPSGGNILVYQPQVASWDKQTHIVAFSAVSHRAKGGDKPALGTIKLEATTKVALEDRLVNFQGLKVVEADFPLRLNRKVVVGHWSNDGVQQEIGTWVRAACAWADWQGAMVARFGDNMRDVAVTESDKVEAQIQLGYDV